MQPCKRFLILAILSSHLLPTVFPFYGSRLLTNGDIDSGSDSAWAVASYYKKGCWSTGVLISNSKVLAQISCFGAADNVQEMGVSLASITPMTTVSQKPAAREFHSVSSYSKNKFVTMDITPPTLPPIYKTTPVPLSASPNPPPAGKRCIGFSFGGDSGLSSTTLNTVQFTVLDFAKCQELYKPMPLDPKTKFCAWVTVNGVPGGKSMFCNADVSAIILCEKWGSATPLSRRRDEKIFLSKDDDEDDETTNWVFAGFPYVYEMGSCGALVRKPAVFDYVNKNVLVQQN